MLTKQSVKLFDMRPATGEYGDNTPTIVTVKVHRVGKGFGWRRVHIDSEGLYVLIDDERTRFDAHTEVRLRKLIEHGL